MICNSTATVHTKFSKFEPPEMLFSSSHLKCAAMNVYHMIKRCTVSPTTTFAMAVKSLDWRGV